jgi:hypothetical protein
VIPPAELARALSAAAPRFETLEALYRRLPDTRCECDTPGRCCVFLPEMTLVEALAWIRRIGELAAPRRSALIRGFAAYFLTNPARFPGCPFRLEGKCGIYPQRTFACRAYGIWRKAAGAERTRRSREDKQRLKGMWQRYGIELPEDPAAREIDYCGKVRELGPRSADDRQLIDILQEIYDLDDGLGPLRERFEGDCHSDFSFFITALVLGQRQAVLGKFAVIKELVQQGSDTRLQKLLARVDARSPQVIVRSL